MRILFSVLLAVFAVLAVIGGSSAYDGTHTFEGVDSLSCETCRYMVSHILNGNVNMEAVCQSMRGQKGKNNMPLSAACAAFVSKNGAKIKSALEPAAVCQRMGKCTA